MTSVLNVDTIAAKDGTSAATLTKQSAPKVWCSMDGTGTASIRDSFNTSSITDNTTGKFTFNLTNAMDDANYAFVAAVGRGSDGGPRILGNELAEPTTTALRMSVWTTAVVGVDPEILCVEFNGDLA